MKKPCPHCHTKISYNLFGNRDDIIRCPQCKKLLVENRKRKEWGALLLLVSFLAALMVHHTFHLHILWGILIIIASFTVLLRITKYDIIHKDLVIRNKETGEIGFIDNCDWDEILKNAESEEINLEILEHLK